MPKEKKDMDVEALTLRLPKTWHDALRLRAFNERRPVSELIREALQEHFKLPDPPRRNDE